MEFKPYCDSIDINDSGDNQVLVVLHQLEKLFAVENCKQISSIYHCNNDLISAHEGFGATVLSRSSSKIEDIIHYINKRFDIRMKEDAYHNEDINDGVSALEFIFRFIHDSSSDEKMLHEMRRQLNVLERILGKYRTMYSIDVLSYGLDGEELFISFYMTQYCWMILFEDYLLLLSYGSDE